MCWRCALAHERGSHHRSPSPKSPPSCNAFWRFVWPRQRICSASQDRKRSSTMSSAILSSNRPVCACRAHRPRSGRFCARQAAFHRIVAASPGHWSSGNRARKFSSISKMKASCLPIRDQQAAACGRGGQLRRCWHLDLVTLPGRQRFRCRGPLRGRGPVFVPAWLAWHAHL
jgi:hypothetical protein